MATTTDQQQNIQQMAVMYEIVCKEMNKQPDEETTIDVIALYDCVSILLALMTCELSIRMSFDKAPNATRLHEKTHSLNKHHLNELFLGHDKIYLGRENLTAAMHAVKFDQTQQKLFWHKVGLLAI